MRKGRPPPIIKSYYASTTADHTRRTTTTNNNNNNKMPPGSRRNFNIFLTMLTSLLIYLLFLSAQLTSSIGRQEQERQRKEDLLSSSSLEEKRGAGGGGGVGSTSVTVGSSSSSVMVDHVSNLDEEDEEEENGSELEEEMEEVEEEGKYVQEDGNEKMENVKEVKEDNLNQMEDEEEKEDIVLKNEEVDPAEEEKRDSNDNTDTKQSSPSSNNVLTAYFETTDQEEWKTLPLPTRTTTSSTLTTKSYPSLTSCPNLPSQLPTSEESAPTNTDPFLPWIHDVFPTADGKYVQFVAQNKRRCQSGTQMGDIKKFMQPNVALFQHVPVERIGRDGDGEERYRLSSSHEGADPDSVETRFICRFKPTMEQTLSTFNVNYDYNTYRKNYKSTFTEEGFDVHIIWNSQLLFKCPVPEGLVEKVRSGETVVGGDGDDDGGYATMFVDLIPIRTPPRYIRPSTFLPPKYGVEDGESWNATLHYGTEHVLPRIEDSGRLENVPICKPSLMTYPDEVPPSQLSSSASSEKKEGEEEEEDGEGKEEGGDMDADSKKVQVTPYNTDAEFTEENDRKMEEFGKTGKKKHKLIACTWTSASFKTRGDRTQVSDGAQRLLQWLVFNKLVGIDHVYIYDNSGSFSTTNNLKSITDLFPGFVTRIDWPAKICNNRPGTGDNKGERSSQYAAESSCRLRFGAHSEWLASFDTDEYPTPLGKYDDLKTLLDDLEKEDIRVVNFGSKRSKPRVDKLNIKQVSEGCPSCFDPSLPQNSTFYEAYNCNIEKPPRKNLMPAEKQIYKPDYVLLHFVHYSAITTISQMSEQETRDKKLFWRQMYRDRHTRYVDEITEASMLHAKALVSEETRGWKQQCQRNLNNAKVGIPYPADTPTDKNGKPSGEMKKVRIDGEDYTPNCFPIERIESYWAPKVKQALWDMLGEGKTY